jgi:hypothetical protein
MDDSYFIYFKIWSAVETAVGYDTVLAAFESMEQHCSLGPAQASYGPTTRIERPKERRRWLTDRLAERDHNFERSGDVHQISMWGVKRKQLTWMLEVDSMAEHDGPGSRQRDPSLLVMFDVCLAREDDRVGHLADDLARLALADRTVWFGLIDPAPSSLIRHPRFYSGSLFNGPDWEHLVEQAYWRHDALGTRDRVRGIYWGNIYGAAFAKKIREAGYAERMRSLEEHPIPGVREGQSGATTIEGPHGGMAVLLDDNPRWFARTRQRRMHSLERAVMTGAALKSTLSRAGLL